MTQNPNDQDDSDLQLAEWYKLGANKGEDFKFENDLGLSHERDEIIQSIMKEMSVIIKKKNNC